MLKLEMLDTSEEVMCPGCQREFTRVYGAFYEDGEGAGVYSVDLHFGKERRYAYLAMAAPGKDGKTYGVVCHLWTTDDQYQVSFVDPPDLKHFHDNFGLLMDRATALKSPLKDTFFHFSDHICESDLRVKRHFGSRDA